MAVSRIAHVAIKTGVFAVEVVEVSSQALIRCGGEWPKVIGTGSNHTGTGWGASKGKGKESTLMDCATGRTVDGLVVCYDANDGDSWKTAKVLLGMCLRNPWREFDHLTRMLFRTRFFGIHWASYTSHRNSMQKRYGQSTCPHQPYNIPSYSIRAIHGSRQVSHRPRNSPCPSSTSGYCNVLNHSCSWSSK